MATAEIQPGGFIQHKPANTDTFKTHYQSYLKELSPYKQSGGITLGSLAPILWDAIKHFNTYRTGTDFQKLNIISHLSGCANYSFWDLSKDIYKSWRNTPFPPIEIQQEIEGQRFNFIYDPRKYNPTLFRNNIAKLRFMLDEKGLAFNENTYTSLTLAEREFLQQNKMAYWIKGKFMPMAGFQTMSLLENYHIMDIRDGRVEQTLAMLTNEHNRHNLKPSVVANITGKGYSHQQYTSDRDTALCLQTETASNQLQNFNGNHCLSSGYRCPLIERCGAIALDKIRGNNKIDLYETARIQGKK